MTALQLISFQDHVASQPEIIIIPTVPAHLREMAGILRPEDEQEIVSFGLTPKKALWQSYRHSVLRKTAFIDGKLAALWGCSGTLLSDNGRPWLMTTPEVKRISPLKFTRIYQQEALAMLEMFGQLCNFVETSYTEAIRLLEISGFTVEPPESLGPNGESFRVFWRVK
jgi:hypothetical protein